MAFIGTKELEKLLSKSEVISPFDMERIKNGAYELSLGSQVFQTDSSPRAVKALADDAKIEIKPGQFALLLTNEYVKIPNDKIAFISIKAGIKFKGLINVSGFHVDPGFEGKLLFSVYNAGPANIVMSAGTPYFPIWFAELNETQKYTGNHDKLKSIPDPYVEALSQGELASPSVLSKRIDEVKFLNTKIEWAVLVVIGFLVTISVRLWTESNKLKEAVEFGYAQKTEELANSSFYRQLHDDIQKLNGKVDSLNTELKKVDSLNTVFKKGLSHGKK